VAVKGKHGAMLAGRYRLLEQLGEGGMGSVWKAEHLLLHSHVAIKIIDPDVARLEFNLARFLREAKTLATLRSPNVVQVLDFGSDVDTPYLVMELLQGQTLGRRLTEQGRISLGETSRILADVCTAMSLVHEQGLIHRDLKPENIFLCNTGDQQVTKVVDFGIAKSLRGELASMKTRTGHMLGTPSYMSPEQCRGLKDIDHRADLWALGVIAYECLVGKVPFEGEVLGDLLLRICMDPLPIPSQQSRGALPSSFDAWFAKAVARDRSVRFQSALELATSLSELSTTLGFGSTRSAGESRERSRPSVPRVSALVASSATPRQPSNTETNTTIGVGAGSSRRADRRARVLAAAGVLGCAALGLWALGNTRTPEVPVELQGLRPYVVTPKVIRSGVPSGRRWLSAPAVSAANTPATAAPGSRSRTSDPRAPADVDGKASPSSVFHALSPSSSPPSRLPPDALPPHAAPPYVLPPNGVAAGPGSNGAAGSSAPAPSAPGGAASGQAPAVLPGPAHGTAAAHAPASPPTGSSATRSNPAPDAPAPPNVTPTRAHTPPRALRGTASPTTPGRSHAPPSSEAGIRRSR
jgi:serine/threonine protein kinase